MELEGVLVAGADVRTARGILQVNRRQIFKAVGGEVPDGVQRQAVQPGLQGQAFGFLSSVPQGAGNGLVNDFFLGDGVGRNLVSGFAVGKLAFDETLQSSKIGVDVGTDVVLGDGGRLNGGEGFLEG